MHDQQMNPWRALAIVALAVAIFLAALWVIDQFVQSELALGIIGGAAAIITASINYRAAKEKETESRLFSEKQKVYSELIEMIMGLFHNAKVGDEGQPNEELVERIKKVRTSLVIWGSFDTIKSLDAMGEAGMSVQNTGNPVEGLRWLGALMENIRRDLGHKDSNGSDIEIALGILVPKDRAKMREMLSAKRPRISKKVASIGE